SGVVDVIAAARAAMSAAGAFGPVRLDGDLKRPPGIPERLPDLPGLTHARDPVVVEPFGPEAAPVDEVADVLLEELTVSRHAPSRDLDAKILPADSFPANVPQR